MKIIHILSGKANPKITLNGVNVVVDKYAGLQYQMGYDVQVWGIANNPCSNRPSPKYPISFFQQHSSFPRRIDNELLVAIRTIDPKNTVLHFHGAFMPEYFRIVHLLSHPIYFLMPHGLYSESALKRKRLVKRLYLELFEKMLIRKSRGLIILHKNEIAPLLRSLRRGVPSFIIPNGADPFLMLDSSSVKVCKRSRHSTIWGYCGRIDNVQKAIDRIVRCFVKFASLYENGRHILSIIGDGPDLAVIMTKYRSEIESGVIEIHGKQFGEAKYNLLRQMDYFIHLSNSEGLPLSCLDALALGIPLLVTPETNLGEDIVKYGAGVVTDRDDESVITAMRSLSNADRTILSNGCLTLTKYKFDWILSCEQLIGLYADALATSSTFA